MVFDRLSFCFHTFKGGWRSQTSLIVSPCLFIVWIINRNWENPKEQKADFIILMLAELKPVNMPVFLILSHPNQLFWVLKSQSVFVFGWKCKRKIHIGSQILHFYTKTKRGSPQDKPASYQHSQSDDTPPWITITQIWPLLGLNKNRFNSLIMNDLIYSFGCVHANISGISFFFFTLSYTMAESVVQDEEAGVEWRHCCR